MSDGNIEPQGNSAISDGGTAFEEVKVYLGSVTNAPLGRKQLPIFNKELPIATYGEPSSLGLTVFFLYTVLRELEALSSQDLFNETGGVLLGEAYDCGSKDRTRIYVEVKDFIHADLAVGSRSNLTLHTILGQKSTQKRI